METVVHLAPSLDGIYKFDPALLPQVARANLTLLPDRADMLIQEGFRHERFSWKMKSDILREKLQLECMAETTRTLGYQ